MTDTPQYKSPPEPKYAVISLEDQQRYPAFARSLKEAISVQIKTMIEPSIRGAVEGCVYNLLGQSSEERYSKDFLDILQSAIVTALSEPSLGISNEQIAWEKQAFEASGKRERQLKSRATVILNLLDSIQMTGNPQDIKAVVDFITDCAREGAMS